jgi:hypothetical protein
MPAVTAQDPFTRLARELSHNRGLIETLLASHPSEGDCRGCRLPGARVPIAAPCSLRSLAVLAASIRAAEQHSGATEVERPGSRSARGKLAGRGRRRGTVADPAAYGL